MFVQYKRPQYFARGHRSPVWPPNREHLAFMVKEKGADDVARYHQVSALHRLESELGSDAMVSYACPSTWRKQELYDRFHDGSLLATSVFVPPSMLVRRGVPAYHSRWTFDPDDRQSGIPNPDGERRNSVDGEGFLDALEEGVGNSGSAEEVLVVAADRITGLRQDVAEARRSAPRAEREANLLEDRAVRREVEELANVSPGARAFVGAAVDIALLARDLRTMWVIALDE
ncbi:hypothetical protein DOE76_12630 [Leifsonia sp. ku-ls]|nr:hypothetical protein DOE76_12630 [Leifsonia sp. ku-ls]